MTITIISYAVLPLHSLQTLIRSWLQPLIARSRRLTSQLSLLSQIITLPVSVSHRDLTRRAAFPRPTRRTARCKTERVDIFVPLIILQSDQRTTPLVVRSDSRKNDCSHCCVRQDGGTSVYDRRLGNAVVPPLATWRADYCLTTRNNIRNSLVACVYSVTGGVT
jgi:hypothetical protein